MSIDQSHPSAPGDDRRRRLMFGLVYPAVLGTLLYSLLPEVAGFLAALTRLLATPAGPKLAVALLIVAHFAIDYVLASEVARYGPLRLAIDTIVVFLLFLAYQGVNLSRPDALVPRQVSLAMAGVYGCFILWAKADYSLGHQLSLVLFESVAVLSFLALWWYEAGAIGLALGLLVFTCALSIVANFVLQRTEARDARPGR